MELETLYSELSIVFHEIKRLHGEFLVLCTAIGDKRCNHGRL